MKWEPIETAPKDGTEIIGWREDCGLLLIRFTSMSEFLTEREIEQHGRRMTEEEIHAPDWFCADFVHGCRLASDEVPTHWMLPSPPRARGQIEEEPQGDDTGSQTAETEA